MPRNLLLTVLCSGLFIALNSANGAPQKQEQGEVESATDKVGDQSQQAMEKAGSAVDTAIDSTGKAIGKAGRSTGQALKMAGKTVAGFFDGHDQPGSPEARSERVREAQTALQEKGHYDGEIDGIPGPKTRVGLRSYQRENGLEATGRLNAESARSLGLK